MAVKVGYVCGSCPCCGRKLCRPRPADIAVCDCWMYCPLCNRKMEPYTPDTQALQLYTEDDVNIIMTCTYHTPPYRSPQKPVEVTLH